MVDDKLLARHLVQTEACTRELLLEGRRLQREAGDGTLYDALIANALVEESVLVKAAATLLNLPTIELTHFVFDDDLVGLMSREMASEHEALPLRRKDGGLMLAMVDPLDIMAMDDIATHVGIDIQPVLVGRADLRDALERAYPMLEESSAIDLGLEGAPEAAAGSNGLEQDSWATFFDDAVAVEVDRESASISQEMRDRPSSLEMSLDELGIEGDAPGVASGTSDILDSFDEPPPEGAGTEGDADDLLDLGEWEVGDANEVPDDDIPKATPDMSGEIDYGVTGDLYVQAENPSDTDEDEDEPIFELSDLVEEDDVIELDDPIEPAPDEDDEPVFVLEDVAEPDSGPALELEPEPEPEAQKDDSEGDIFEDVFAEVAEDASEDAFEALAEPEPEPEPEPKLSALSSLRARLASVKRNPLPKPSTTPAKPEKDEAEAESEPEPEPVAEDPPAEDPPEQAEGDSPDAAEDAQDDGGDEDEDVLVLDDLVEADPAPSTPRTLGRMAVKRIAVKRQTSEIVLPDVIEKNSAQERRESQEQINLTQEVDPDDILLEEIEEEEDEVTLSHEDLFDPGPLSESDRHTIEHDGAIDLNLFEDSEDVDPLDAAPTREFDPEDLLGAADPPTREVQLDDVFGSMSEGVGAESTNASDDVQNEIEEISRALRSRSEPNTNRFSGEFAPVESFSRETTANEALTRDRIAQMNMARKANSSRITTSSPAVLNLPDHVSEGQLLRALITLMIDRKYIDKDELIELAEALPAEDD